ncbi:hypothetical protein HAX54_018632, partial [Datura stramonium]|nr:hypothetical protein [Datura stramonium]
PCGIDPDIRRDICFDTATVYTLCMKSIFWTLSHSSPGLPLTYNTLLQNWTRTFETYQQDRYRCTGVTMLTESLSSNSRLGTIWYNRCKHPNLNQLRICGYNADVPHWQKLHRRWGTCQILLLL